MNTDSIPVLDLSFFRGISYPLTFSYSHVDGSGTVTGPYDLTGWEVVAIFRGAIHSTDLTLSSDDPANANGSILELTNAAGGLFRFNLTAAELSTPTQADGDWRIEIRQGVEAIILVRGHTQFIPFVTGGEI